MMTTLAGVRQIRRSPWLWSFVGSIAVLIAIEVISHHFSTGDLTVNLGLGGFLVVVGVGQMFVITGGNGGIDLSVPWVITLSAITTSAVMHSHNGLTLEGAAAALGTGVAAGVVNGALVLGLQLAPIVATLASGFVMQSLVQITYGAAEVGGPSTALENFVRGDILGLPSMLWVALVVTIIGGYVLQSTLYGRHLEAAGQSEPAARLTGVHVARVRFISYVISGCTAGLAGLLLCGFAGGAFLDIGTPYQMGSIAAVVLGGSLIAGGRSTSIGVFGGAMLLTFLLTLMGVSNLSVGLRDVLEGLVIVIVLVVRKPD